MKNQYHPNKEYTLGGLFRAYLTDLTQRMESGEVAKNAVSLARTAILKYAVPGLGGPVCSGKRTTQADIEGAMRFLDSLLSDRVQAVVAAQERYFEQAQVAAQVRKTNRYQAKLLVNWVANQGLMAGEEQATDPAMEKGKAKPAAKIYRHSSRDAHVQGKLRTREIRLTDRIRRPDFGLRPDEVNAELSQQMATLAQFERDYLDHRPPTINNYAAFIYRVLGWQHRFKQIPLEDLSLQGIIPYTPLKVSLEEIEGKYSDHEEVMAKFFYSQESAKYMAKQKALEAERLIEEYCAFYQDSLQTQIQTLQALIVVAKCLYFRDTENTNSKSGYTDIPIICRLQQKLSAVSKVSKSKTKVISYAKRSVSWEMILDVFKMRQF